MENRLFVFLTFLPGRIINHPKQKWRKEQVIHITSIKYGLGNTTRVWKILCFGIGMNLYQSLNDTEVCALILMSVAFFVNSDWKVDYFIPRKIIYFCACN